MRVTGLDGPAHGRRGRTAGGSTSHCPQPDAELTPIPRVSSASGGPNRIAHVPAAMLNLAAQGFVQTTTARAFDAAGMDQIIGQLGK